jgi:23S rRNA (adenine2503-C2)-methyltransferase
VTSQATLAERSDRPDLRSLTPAELGALLASLGEKPYRTRQIHRWLHQKAAASLDEMTDVPKALREALAARCTLTTLATDLEQRSSDGTIKWRWRTHDGKLVESVYLPEEDRKTLCVSSQVGCAVGCTFCLTGTMGLARNLTPGEIVDQVHRANRRLVELGEGAGARPLTNLVSWGWASRSRTTAISRSRSTCSSRRTGRTSPTVTSRSRRAASSR